MTSMPLSRVFIAIFIIAAVTFFTRVFPFLFFSRRKPPKILDFIQQYIPPMVMVIFVIYSIKDTSWTSAPFGLPEIISLLFVTIIHLWKNNPLISIFGGTILYMIFVQTGILKTLF
jgi:branched-subunit amino acid transport protein AzlD